ncbi:MAG: tRNA (adenosine(37)-N6)-dimethylallyltransferase MiaA [Actinobacteria bacterium]|nr:tRNA (adenosine(37)-N6)-dimethylallyltransferase MiaA [Actinomycetota bacterium]
MASATSPVLALVGPTASGKTGLALGVAGSRPGPVELVAVDAFTVYRGMDIGTAKPTPAERGDVPHHLVDVLDPDEDVSVAWFQTQARAVVDEVLGRGATPLLVGGSGLYFRAVVDDLRFPPTDPDVRAGLEERWADRPRAAWAHLEERDPDAAARIDPGNLRRTVRALEVLELTGERFSSFRASWDTYASSRYPGLDVAYLEPPTAELRAAIRDRSRRMVAAGLLDEARDLRARFGALSSTARQAIGYQEALAVLDGDLAEDDLAGAVADRTWAYARRQRSWFRRDPRCTPTSPAEVLTRWT